MNKLDDFSHGFKTLSNVFKMVPVIRGVAHRLTRLKPFKRYWLLKPQRRLIFLSTSIAPSA